MLALAVLLAALLSTSAAIPQEPAAAPTPAPAAAPAPGTALVASGSKVWIGREAEFEQFLREAKFARFEEVPVGVTKPVRGFFEAGGLAASAVFKVLPPGRPKGYFESHKSEVAAYELDKMMGLGMVPPTVERRGKNNDTGSTQLWVENCVLLKTKDPNTAPDIFRWNRQVWRQRVWDNLIANIDRNAGNLLVDPEWNLVLIDHSRAFTRSEQMPFQMTRIDRPFFAALKALNEADLEAKLGPWLTDGPKPLLKRRDKIVQHFEKLIKDKGEPLVLVP